MVNANNTGGDPTTHQCSETPAPPDFLYPGDCGGGIHLNAVAHSEVEGNTVTNNDDGILLTDDYGPNYGNEVSHNYVAHNIYECGIVLPSHNPFSVMATQNPDHVTYTVGALTPSTGGVYDNTVDHNTVIDNGTVVVPALRRERLGHRRLRPVGRHRLVRQHHHRQLRHRERAVRLHHPRPLPRR